MRTRRIRGGAPTSVAIAISIAIFVGACSKSEPEVKQVRPVTPAPASAPAASPPDAAGASAYAPGEAMKERLARQEAASKLFDSAAPIPPPPRAPEAKPTPAPVKAPEPPKAAAKVEAPKSQPPATVTMAVPPPSAPAKPEPSKVESAPRTDVALAKPAAAAPATRLVRRVEPDFPREAVKAGVYEGTVQARLFLDAAGNVRRVEVIEAQPRRLFDRAVVSALSDWKYNEGAPDRTVRVEIAFKAK